MSSRNALATLLGIAVSFAATVHASTLGPPGLLPTMPQCHNDGAVLAYNGLLYAWSGYDCGTTGGRSLQLDVYDPATGLWSQRASSPAGSGRNSMAEFVLNDRFYFVCGEGPSSGHFTASVFSYSPAENAWTQLPNFPVAAWQMMAAVCNGRAFVFGGQRGYGPTYPQMWEFDPATGGWIQRPSMPYSVMAAGVAVSGDDIFVIGGQHKDSEPNSAWTRSIQVYHTLTNTWALIENAMPWQLYNTKAASLDGEVYLFTRFVDTGEWTPAAHAYLWIPGSGCWYKAGFIPPLPELYINEVPVIDGRAYFTSRWAGDAGAVTPFRAALSEPVQLGDLDCNGAVDFFDIDPFVSALSGPAVYYAVHPTCEYFNGDCDGDGLVTFFDIDPFVTVLSS